MIESHDAYRVRGTQNPGRCLLAKDGHSQLPLPPLNTQPCLFGSGTVRGVLRECKRDRQERAGHVLASLHEQLLRIYLRLWATEAQIVNF